MSMTREAPLVPSWLAHWRPWAGASSSRSALVVALIALGLGLSTTIAVAHGRHHRCPPPSRPSRRECEPGAGRISRRPER